MDKAQIKRKRRTYDLHVQHIYFTHELLRSTRSRKKNEDKDDIDREKEEKKNE